MSWITEKIKRGVIKKFSGEKGLNLYERFKLRGELKKAREEEKKLSFDEQVKRAREMHEAKLKEEMKRKQGNVEEVKTASVKNAGEGVYARYNSRLSREFIDKVRARGNKIYESIQLNKYLTPSKKKIYTAILDFTVSSILEDAISLGEYESKLIEKKYPPEYVKKGVNWFIELTK